MEEFENNSNNNLDKVKRTLLVTLDDISKGLGELIEWRRNFLIVLN